MSETEVCSLYKTWSEVDLLAQITEHIQDNLSLMEWTFNVRGRSIRV